MPIACSLEQKYLNIYSDRKRNFNLHKSYYVITITDIDTVSKSPKSDPIIEDLNPKALQTILKQANNESLIFAEKANGIFSPNLNVNQSPIITPF